jgi:UDP-N-acetylmuramoyl-L-alanyl-D-glutamate--2,6-diaminopimelate ligase
LRRKMELERVIAALAPTAVVRRAPADVRDLAYDSRTVVPGSLFFCVRGAHADGHDLAAEAVARDAVALVVERELDLRVPQIVVTDSRRAMAPAAVAFFGDPSRGLDVAAVTGTAGKTTTTYLIYEILRAAGRRPGLLTNLERRVGDDTRPAKLNTPEAIDLQRLFREMTDAGNGSCAMEATSHASVQGRLDGVRFAVLVFTNLAHEHLDFHGTMDEYFDAKRRLFAQAEHAVVNVGDAWGRRLAAELDDVTTFDAAHDRLDADLKLRGPFNVENALGAAAAARALGIDEDSIRRGIEAVHGVPGRFELVDEGQPFTVIVDYSHKPASLERVLEAARDLARGRVLCVFGCGGDRDSEKRPVMGRIASELADVAIVTSDNPRSEDPLAIIEEVVAGAPGLEVEPDRRAAIGRAIESAREGDVVLIAGKGHEQGQEIAGVVHPFDDRDVARELLRALQPA